MKYGDVTVNSPSRIKRWSHGKRFLQAIELGNIASGDVVADYGAGDGYLLELLLANGLAVEAWAFEPMLIDQVEERLGNAAVISANAADLPDSYFDKVFCMEVLEHLRLDLLNDALFHIRRILKPNGKAIITVPIEIGLSSFFKNSVRYAMKKSHPGTNFSTVIKSVFGSVSDIDRRETSPNYISSHIGFDYRTLPQIIESQGFIIRGFRCSPVPLLGTVLNSQISFIISAKC